MDEQKFDNAALFFIDQKVKTSLKINLLSYFTLKLKEIRVKQGVLLISELRTKKCLLIK